MVGIIYSVFVQNRSNYQYLKAFRAVVTPCSGAKRAAILGIGAGKVKRALELLSHYFPENSRRFLHLS